MINKPTHVCVCTDVYMYCYKHTSSLRSHFDDNYNCFTERIFFDESHILNAPIFPNRLQQLLLRRALPQVTPTFDISQTEFFDYV